MKQYEIKNGHWSGKIVESDKILQGYIRIPVPDDSKKYAWAGKWVEVLDIPDFQALEDKKSWQDERDRIMDSAVIEYKGNYYDMSARSQDIIARSYSSMARGKSANWKVQDKSTGLKKRVVLTKADADKIIDALFDAIQIIHESADTQKPINPWPLLVE